MAAAYIDGMSNFKPENHPRAADGVFTETVHSDPETSLVPEDEPEQIVKARELKPGDVLRFTNFSRNGRWCTVESVVERIETYIDLSYRVNLKVYVQGETRPMCFSGRSPVSIKLRT